MTGKEKGGLLPGWKEVSWCGDSRKRVKAWPKAVRALVGNDLAVVQLGEFPDGCEPLNDVGQGAYAIRIKSGKEQYRVIWVAVVNNTVSVLHAFHKKSKKGIETPQSDKDVARERLKQVLGRK